MQLAARIRPRDLEDFFSAVGKVGHLPIVIPGLHLFSAPTHPPSPPRPLTTFPQLSSVVIIHLCCYIAWQWILPVLFLQWKLGLGWMPCS